MTHDFLSESQAKTPGNNDFRSNKPEVFLTNHK